MKGRVLQYCECGHRKAPKREKALAEDPDMKPYIRAKRNRRNLPEDGQTDTKWIKRQRTWKSKSKKKQWM
jgi:hypothetical protein